MDKLDQIEKFLGKCDWLASRSRIIITTRDKHLLANLGNGLLTYEVQELDELVANPCDARDSLTKLNCGASIEQRGRRIKNIC